MSYRDEEVARLQCELAETRRQRDAAQDRLRRIDESAAKFRASQVEPKLPPLAKPKSEPDGVSARTAIVLGMIWLVGVIVYLHLKVWTGHCR